MEPKSSVSKLLGVAVLLALLGLGSVYLHPQLFPPSPGPVSLVLSRSLASKLKIENNVMAPAPKRLDSVEVHNKMSGPVTVTVAFDNHKDKIELLEEHQIQAGESYLFKEKSLDMGSWQAVAPVKSVSVTHSNGSNSVEPAVEGVVKKVDVHVLADGKLEQQP